ncbi:MAG: type II toxin-antitoxin system VapC family toxin [Thermocrispum sp.]
MKLLLDTHTWLWMQAQSQRFSAEAMALLEDLDNELLLSSASSWEIAIKHALGKLPLPSPPEEYVPDRMRSSGVVALPVTHTHALKVAALPEHHRDPFDRMLIAQAKTEQLTILTADRTFERYDVAVRWSA